jgi:hypothetical protein
MWKSRKRKKRSKKEKIVDTKVKFHSLHMLSRNEWATKTIQTSSLKLVSSPQKMPHLMLEQSSHHTCVNRCLAFEKGHIFYLTAQPPLICWHVPFFFNNIYISIITKLPPTNLIIIKKLKWKYKNEYFTMNYYS